MARDFNIQYNLPTESMNKVIRQFNALKSAGIQVQPWQLEQAWKEEMAKQGAKETTDLAFNTNLVRGEQQRDLERAERLRQFNLAQGQQLRQTEADLAERKRQFDLGLTEDQRRTQDYIKSSQQARDASEEAGKWGLASNFLTGILGGLKTKKIGG